MAPLDITHLSLLVVHFLGLAALIGPFFMQLFEQRTPYLRLMLAGAAAQVVSGNALIATRRFQGLEIDELKMGVKLGFAVLALTLVVVAMRRRRSGVESLRPPALAAGALGIAALVVAVVWR